MYAYHDNIFEVSVIEIKLIIFFCVLLLLLIRLVRCTLLHKIVVYLHCVRIYHCVRMYYSLLKRSVLFWWTFGLLPALNFSCLCSWYPDTQVSVEKIQVEQLNCTMCVSLTSLCNAKVLSKVVLTIYLNSNAQRGFLILRTGGDIVLARAFSSLPHCGNDFPPSQWESLVI